MLLLKGSTVVYIRRSVDRSSWFYEFVPSFNNNGTIKQENAAVGVKATQARRIVSG